MEIFLLLFIYVLVCISVLVFFKGTKHDDDDF